MVDFVPLPMFQPEQRMDSRQLANILNQMYFDAEDGKQVAMILLFGIRYSNEIRDCEDSPATIARKAEIPETYGTEIHRGCNLAPYVTVRDSVGFPSGRSVR